MTSPDYTIVYSAVLSGSAGTGSPGDVLLPETDGDGDYILSTTANRGTRRSTGIALTSYVASGVVNIQQHGQVANAITSLGTGTASWVRVSSTGTLERCTPSGSDDIVGYCETDGTLHACFGLLTATLVNGGGSSAAPSGDYLYKVTAGVMDAASVQVTDALVATGAAIAVAKLATGTAYHVVRTNAAGTAVESGAIDLTTAAVTGVLPSANVASHSGDVTGAHGATVVAKVNGTTITTAGGALAVGAVLRTTAVGTADWGAVNLADTDAVTGVLPTANQAAPTGTGMVTVTSGAWDAAATALGTGVATWFTTPSSANLLAAVTDETGTGALVFANTPTLVTPVIGAATGTSLAASSFVSVGASAAGSGGVRLANATSIMARKADNSADYGLLGLSSVNELSVGADHTTGNQVLYLNLRSALGTYIGASGAGGHLVITSASIASSNPVIGYASPYSAHGAVVSSITDVTAYTAPAAEYAYDFILVSTVLSAGCTFKLPTPATEAASYTQGIFNDTGRDLAITRADGAGVTVSMTTGTRGWFCVRPGGVYLKAAVV